MDKFNRAFEPLWVWLHRGYIVRRIILGVAVWMMLDSYQWAKMYALTEEPNQFIYTAVLAVPAAFLATATKLYSDGRDRAYRKPEDT